MKKRFWSAVLAVCMALVLLPGPARAEAGPDVGATSGTCGDNLTWTLDTATETLTISGTGAMENYTYDNPAPWNSQRQNIQNAVISTGVTSIGDYAFSFCNLTNVTIPDSVTSIGNSAFYDCNFTSITLPEGLTAIADNMFENCGSLTSIAIPDGVTSIGDSAFRWCLDLTSVTIPDSVTFIGDNAFGLCTSLTSVTIPDGVPSIGPETFMGNLSLTSVIIPDSVTSIGESAFKACPELSLTIPKSVTTIREGAFSPTKLVAGNIFNGDAIAPPKGPIYYGGSPDDLTRICVPSFDDVFNELLATYPDLTPFSGNIFFTPTLTQEDSGITPGMTNPVVIINSDMTFNLNTATDVTNYIVTNSTTRNLGTSPLSAVLSNNDKTLTLTLSGTVENAPLTVTIDPSVFLDSVSAAINLSFSVALTPTPPPTLAPTPTPTPPPSRPSDPGPVSTPKPTPTGPRVERVEDEVQVQTPPPVGVSGQGESEYQEIVKDGEYTRWIDRVDLPDYANNLYTMLCIGGDYDEQYDLLIDDKYYRFPTGGGSKGTSEVESVLELVSDLDLPYSSGGGVFQESHFTGGYDTVDASLGDKAVQYAALKEGDLVRTSTYNAIYVSKVAKSSPSYDADLKAACAYAQSAFQAFDRDHPEIFWLSGRSKLRMVTVTLRDGTQTYQETYIFFVLADKDGFTIRDSKYPNQAAIEADILRRDQAVGAILSTVTATTPHEQAAQLNRWLTEHNEYNTSQDLQNIPNWPHECLSALVGSAGTEGPVCDGYARAFQVLCGKLGITCVLVDGYAKVKADSAGEFHMWNSVQMPDGKWYGVDVTWNDPTVKGVSGPKSGYEREDFLMVGADTVVLGLKFSESHPPKNRAADGAVAFLNGPALNTAAYNPMSAASVLPFVDVKPEAWYYDAVSDVFEQGLMTGKSDTVFGPQDGMTRAMAWTVLGRMSGEELAGGGTPWYQEAQNWAVAESLSDGSAPERTLSREELVTMLWRAEGSPAAEADLSAFTDGETVSDWAVPAVRWAVSEDILKGSSGKLNPSGTATRAEVASLLTRFHGRAE